MNPKNILIIRLGALGDILLSMQAFQDIRARYPHSRISFLTTPPFAALARTMPWFDDVLVYPRMPFYRLDELFALGMQFTKGGYDLVIDLQNKPRTAVYYHLFFQWRGIHWSGRALGATHKAPPFTNSTHHQQKVLNQVRALGVPDSGTLNMDWMQAPLTQFNLPANYVVLIPGCAPHRPEKRWPTEAFVGTARHFVQQGLMPVLIGTKADAEAINAIAHNVPEALSLLGKTGFAELASLFRGAKGVIGNDTGPMHLAALVGAPTLSVMSAATNAAQSAPVGPRAGFIQRDDLKELLAADVLNALEKI